MRWCDVVVCRSFALPFVLLGFGQAPTEDGDGPGDGVGRQVHWAELERAEGAVRDEGRRCRRLVEDVGEAAAIVVDVAPEGDGFIVFLLSVVESLLLAVSEEVAEVARVGVAPEEGEEAVVELGDVGELGGDLEDRVEELGEDRRRLVEGRRVLELVLLVLEDEVEALVRRRRKGRRRGGPLQGGGQGAGGGGGASFGASEGVDEGRREAGPFAEHEPEGAELLLDEGPEAQDRPVVGVQQELRHGRHLGRPIPACAQSGVRWFF
mmetsp:Transcript_10907/g.36145  ORF Transcript_10907/g.36145 Transcript_10907/m.36145 type:complete len:265 (-) Transcript_10907:231-1025(-)